MRIIEFSSTFSEEFLCEAKYLDGADNVVSGIVLSPPTRNHNSHYVVRIDSASHKIPLKRVLKLTKSSRKWEDL